MRRGKDVEEQRRKEGSRGKREKRGPGGRGHRVACVGERGVGCVVRSETMGKSRGVKSREVTGPLEGTKE